MHSSIASLLPPLILTPKCLTHASWVPETPMIFLAENSESLWELTAILEAKALRMETDRHEKNIMSRKIRKGLCCGSITGRAWHTECSGKVDWKKQTYLSRISNVLFTGCPYRYRTSYHSQMMWVQAASAAFVSPIYYYKPLQADCSNCSNSGVQIALQQI